MPPGKQAHHRHKPYEVSTLHPNLQQSTLQKNPHQSLFSQLEQDIFVLNKIKHEQPGVVVLCVDTACAGYFGSG